MNMNRRALLLKLAALVGVKAVPKPVYESYKDIFKPYIELRPPALTAAGALINSNNTIVPTNAKLRAYLADLCYNDNLSLAMALARKEESEKEPIASATDSVVHNS